MNTRVACVLALLCAFHQHAQAVFPKTLWVQVAFYDYHADGTNPNFQPAKYSDSESGVRPGMVWPQLGQERKPRLCQNLVYNDQLDEWFRPSGIEGTDAAFSIDPVSFRSEWSGLQSYDGRTDEFVGPNFDSGDPMACVVMYDSLPFGVVDSSIGLYEFRSDEFFPVDRRGFGSELPPNPPYLFTNPSNHNYSFAMEMHTEFVYRPGAKLRVCGADDDVWVFVAGELAIDLGGIHGPERGILDLDTLGLSIGGRYALDIFLSERYVTQSHFCLTLPAPISCAAAIRERTQKYPADGCALNGSRLRILDAISPAVIATYDLRGRIVLTRHVGQGGPHDLSPPAAGAFIARIRTADTDLRLRAVSIRQDGAFYGRPHTTNSSAIPNVLCTE